MKRCVEHYSYLYSIHNIVSHSAFDAIKVIDRLASGKAPGSDRDPAWPDKALQNHLIVSIT